MSPESNESPRFSDYPINLFEEPRDHANQWDIRALWPDHTPPSREEKGTHPAARRGRRPRDHANQWDVRALWPDSKGQAHNDKEA